MLGAYHRRLTGDDEEVKVAAAKHLSRWLMATLQLYVDDECLRKAEWVQWSLQVARIQRSVEYGQQTCPQAYAHAHTL